MTGVQCKLVYRPIAACDPLIAGITKLAEIKASYEELATLFGVPEAINEVPSRVRVEWRFAFARDQAAVIHDRREPVLSLRELGSWTLCGHHAGIATRVDALLQVLRSARSHRADIAPRTG